MTMGLRRLPVTCLVVLSGFGSLNSAFVVLPSSPSTAARLSEGNSRLFSSSSWRTPEQERLAVALQRQQQQEQRVETPAVVFGNPLSDLTKKLNKSFVHAIKTLVFDTLYPTTGIPETQKSRDASIGGVSVAHPTALSNSLAQQQHIEKVMVQSFVRFYALETIARMPYFSYLSVLHLYETLGQWRQAEYLKVHFAESWNELHHLLIMEELLDHQIQWKDQFVAQHVACFYYWMVAALYVWNPTLAYNLNQSVEEEAFATYDSFLRTHGDSLKALPAPRVAVEYYTGNDLYLFHAMHLSASSNNAATKTTAPPRPALECKTLYDTFSLIRNDEMEHVKTMIYLQQQDEKKETPSPFYCEQV